MARLTGTAELYSMLGRVNAGLTDSQQSQARHTGPARVVSPLVLASNCVALSPLLASRGSIPPTCASTDPHSSHRPLLLLGRVRLYHPTPWLALDHVCCTCPALVLPAAIPTPLGCHSALLLCAATCKTQSAPVRFLCALRSLSASATLRCRPSPQMGLSSTSQVGAARLKPPCADAISQFVMSCTAAFGFGVTSCCAMSFMQKPTSWSPPGQTCPPCRSARPTAPSWRSSPRSRMQATVSPSCPARQRQRTAATPPAPGPPLGPAQPRWPHLPGVHRTRPASRQPAVGARAEVGRVHGGAQTSHHGRTPPASHPPLSPSSHSQYIRRPRWVGGVRVQCWRAGVTACTPACMVSLDKLDTWLKL